MGKKIMGGLFELPSTPDNYYNLHDPEKSFESILFRDGYVLQGRELKDLQELFFEHARGLGDALFAVGGQRIQISPAQQHAIGAQRDHAHHIETVTNTTVGEDGDIAFYRIGDGRQRTG